MPRAHRLIHHLDQGAIAVDCVEEATMLIPNDLSKRVAEKSFGANVSGDTVVLPGVMSRKKQIIPNLKV